MPDERTHRLVRAFMRDLLIELGRNIMDEDFEWLRGQVSTTELRQAALGDRRSILQVRDTLRLPAGEYDWEVETL